jgi:hypothetical protein
MKTRNSDNKDILKNRNLWAAILMILFVCFYKPPIVEAIGKLFRSTFYAAINFQSFQTNLKMPHAGENILPSAVQEMLALLQTHQLDSYQLSEQISNKKNILIYQRIVESAWPRRTDPKSNYKLILVNELDDYSDCEVKERGKEAALVFCR